MESISDVSSTDFEPIKTASSDQFTDLETLAEQHYGDCNVRAYFVKIGLAQEELRNDRLTRKSQELRQERKNLGDITQFLELLGANPHAKEVSLVGHNELTDRIYQLLPDERLKKDKLTMIEAQMLSHALTRHSDQQITVNIQELTTDMTHIIEDMDKILPILKDLMTKYDDLINRINNKQK